MSHNYRTIVLYFGLSFCSIIIRYHVIKSHKTEIPSVWRTWCSRFGIQDYPQTQQVDVPGWRVGQDRNYNCQHL